MTPGRLFVSFWNLGLENLPEGQVSHYRMKPRYAQLCIELARKEGRLLCLSDDDLLAPYHKDSRDNHEALCAMLKARFGIALSLDDFIECHDDHDGPRYSARPLSCMKLQADDRLLVITCAFAMEEERQKEDFVFRLAPETVEFHMVETAEDSTKAAEGPGATLPEPIPITQDELSANFEATLDRAEAGEIFKIITEGSPPVYMVPFRYSAYYRPEERE